ncbi:type III pantothenate kinase [Alphaproteobacteria bacterium]|nr:type III pantothenate kinase [Alphaproteobacteria bacterium]MDC1023419.1 type III pantothenate kinase [Alphaproteobacteria bacterium]
MILTIDCGNTNTVFAIYSYKNGIKQEGCWRINNNSKRTADTYYPWFLQMLTLSDINKDNITGICIASVVAETLLNIKTLIKKYFKINPLIVDRNIFDLGLKVNIDNPEEAGADRLVNSFAAKCLKLSPAIIIDFGTATTFDLVGEDGSYNGGIIAPGVNLSLEALYLAAARLPRVTLKPLSSQKSIIGKNTINAMESGIYWGYVSMIEGLINKIKALDEYKNYKIIATGGLSNLFENSLPCIDYIKEDLTLIGLVNLYLKNLKNRN